MSLPAIITPALLSTIRSHPHLPANTWYFIAGAALSTLNRPDEIPKVLTHALEKGGGPPSTSSHSSSSPPSPSEQLSIARRTREALVKSAAIVGLPKTINALVGLKAATPPHLLDTPTGPSPTARATDIYTTPSSQILARGQKFFEQVYGKVTERVMGQMDGCGAPDLGLLARIEYGYILSPSRVLNAAESSFVVLASLIPQDVNPQLKGHLVGALNNGATEDEVKAVREVVLAICEAAGMRRLDPGSHNSWGWREDVATLKIKAKL